MPEMSQEKRDELLQRAMAICLRLADCQNGPAQYDLEAELGDLVESLWLDGAAGQ